MDGEIQGEWQIVDEKHLLALIDQTSEQLPGTLPDPQAWADWLLYLLEALDAQSQSAGQVGEYEAMLNRLIDQVNSRKDLGNWWGTIKQ
jgi:hypothetical protein